MFLVPKNGKFMESDMNIVCMVLRLVDLYMDFAIRELDTSPISGSEVLPCYTVN